MRSSSTNIFKESLLSRDSCRNSSCLRPVDYSFSSRAARIRSCRQSELLSAARDLIEPLQQLALLVNQGPSNNGQCPAQHVTILRRKPGCYSMVIRRQAARESRSRSVRILRGRDQFNKLSRTCSNGPLECGKSILGGEVVY